MNKQTLIGNLGNDCTVRDVKGKKAISFSVAFSEKWADRDAVMQEKTTWYNCVIWRKEGQSTEISKYLKKGDKVYIEGKPDAKIYNDREGVARIDNTIVVTQIELLSSKPKEPTTIKEPANQSQRAVQQAEASNQQQEPEVRYVADDDLPF